MYLNTEACILKINDYNNHVHRYVLELGTAFIFN